MKVHAVVHVIEIGIGNVTSAILKVKWKAVTRPSVWLPLGWDNEMRHSWGRDRVKGTEQETSWANI